jgi:hypothetical protein
MSTKRYLAELAVVVVFSVGLSAQGNRPSQISVDDPRPVASAVEKLQKLYGRVITYEDPQWIVASETLTVFLPEPGQSGEDAVRTVLQEIIVANSAARNPGEFRWFQSDGRLHVVPVANGNTDRQLPLDVPISIAEKERNGIEILEAICQQLSASTGKKVILGIIPVNAFAQHHGSYGASGETARDVLSSVLDSIGAGYSWRLLFDPGVQEYALNIHWVGSSGLTSMGNRARWLGGP